MQKAFGGRGGVGSPKLLVIIIEYYIIFISNNNFLGSISNYTNGDG